MKLIFKWCKIKLSLNESCHKSITVGLTLFIKDNGTTDLTQIVVTPNEPMYNKFVGGAAEWCKCLKVIFWENVWQPGPLSADNTLLDV